MNGNGTVGTQEGLIPPPPFAGIPFTPGWVAHELTLATGQAIGEDWTGAFEAPATPGELTVAVLDPVIAPIRGQINLAIIAAAVAVPLAVVGLGVGGFLVWRITR